MTGYSIGTDDIIETRVIDGIKVYCGHRTYDFVAWTDDERTIWCSGNTTDEAIMKAAECHKSLIPSLDLSSIPESLRGLKWEMYEHGMVFENGDQLLLAVPVITKWTHETTEIHGVTVDCDEDRFRLECTASGETYDLDLTDCNLFVRI